MKQILIPIILYLTFTLTSCNGDHTDSNDGEQIPEALQDKSSLSEIKSYSRGGDLIENLYSELASKTPELKKLEDEIKALEESQSDSTTSFNTFNGKNQSYYTSAKSYTVHIQDSVLRERVKSIISGSLTKYNSLITTHLNLLDSIEQKNVRLNDLHSALKLIRTLRVIEKYQNDNVPSSKSLKGFEQELDKSLKHTDSLINK